MIQALPSDINKNGFKYKLIKRDEKRALYAQFTGDGIRILGFEVFKIIVKRPNKFRVNSTEAFPSDSDFGKTAWSIANYGNQARCLERAKAKYDSIK